MVFTKCFPLYDDKSDSNIFISNLQESCMNSTITPVYPSLTQTPSVALSVLLLVFIFIFCHTGDISQVLKHARVSALPLSFIPRPIVCFLINMLTKKVIFNLFHQCGETRQQSRVLKDMDAEARLDCLVSNSL